MPDPRPAAGDVLVRIKASAINLLDGIVRMGYLPIAKKPPLILGEEAAGAPTPRSFASWGPRG